MGVFGANICKKWNINVLFKKKNPVKNLIIALKFCMYVHFFLTGTSSVSCGWIRYIYKISIDYVKKGFITI